MTDAQPPAEIRAWMDRLTVDHEYDPETGFIVAKEVVSLPAVIAAGQEATELIGMPGSGLVVVFATADRCAPCQQYKKSALNDKAVIEMLSGPGMRAVHVEVDRQPELAASRLGSKAIPMTYLFDDGVRVAELRGQRSADELLDWLGQFDPES